MTWSDVRPILRYMTSYAILWQRAGGAPVAGRLELGEKRLTLHGGHRGAEQRLEIPYCDIYYVQRARENVGPLRGIEVDAYRAGTIRVATIGGLSLRSEILERLQGAAAAFAFG
jgi:hypothetical protein